MQEVEEDSKEQIQNQEKMLEADQYQIPIVCRLMS